MDKWTKFGVLGTWASVLLVGLPSVWLQATRQPTPTPVAVRQSSKMREKPLNRVSYYFDSGEEPVELAVSVTAWDGGRPSARDEVKR